MRALSNGRAVVVATVLLVGCAGTAPIGSNSPTTSASTAGVTATASATMPIATTKPSPSPSPTRRPTPRPTPQATPSPTPVAYFEDIILVGSGNTIQPFTIPEQATAIVSMNYTETDQFLVWSLDANGERKDLLCGRFGPYNGTTLMDWSGHSTALDINADGDWGIAIRYITKADQWDPSMAISGTSDNVFILSPRPSTLISADVAYAGTGNFMVTAYNSTGAHLLVNTVGTYTGEVLMPSDTVLLTIVSDGDWRIRPT
jgi:hypothetical protein